MLVFIAKVGDQVWERGVVCPSSVIFGRDIIDNVLQCPSNGYDETCNDFREHSYGDGQSKRSSAFILTQDTNDYLFPAVSVLKVCSCFQDLLDERDNSLKLRMDSYLFSCFLNEVANSETFRKNVINFFLIHPLVKRKIVKCYLPGDVARPTYHLQIVILLRWPENLKIDFAWDGRMQRLTDERHELENLMAWLSTLGGAYSALGEDYVHCAQVAGKISLHQLRIALTLGDPIISAKCKVYFSISLLQRGYLKEPILMIREQYKFANSLHENVKDVRLLNMCKGVWAKIQYLYRLRRRKKPKPTGHS